MNELSQRELWKKIQDFNFDDPSSTFPFSKKLQKENNWSRAFTLKAIEEYRKFIFLCCILPDGASPSHTVDQVWHMHLTYTENYWNEFCKKTLQKEIHHYPSKGGKAENEKHTDWYNYTLICYETYFEIPPPADIWFSNTTDIKEDIYDKNYYIKVVVLFFGFTLSIILFTTLFNLPGKDFLLYFALLAIGAIIFFYFLQINKSKKLQIIVDQYLPKEYTKWQIMKFLYGPHHTYQVALIDLLKADQIELSGQNFKLNTIIKSPTQDINNPLWENLVTSIQDGESFTYNTGFDLMDQESIKHPEFERLFRLSKKIDYKKFVIPGIVFFIGIARVIQGMGNNKPIDFLVAELVLFGFIITAIASSFSYTSLLFEKIKLQWEEINGGGNSNNILNNFSILGITAISGFAEYSMLNQIFTTYTPQKGTASASSSCSSCTGGNSCGSSCGGGCGGCGGGD